MSENAIANNDKVFPIFAKKLVSDDLSVYSSFAQKLSGWLSSDRAYYPTAKPKILSLLETAQSTIQRQIGDNIQPFHISKCPPPLSQWGEAYEKLVQTVIAHSRHFKDTALQERLQRLAQSISLLQQDFLSTQILDQNTSVTSVNQPPRRSGSSTKHVSATKTPTTISSTRPSTLLTAPEASVSIPQTALQHQTLPPSTKSTPMDQLSSQNLPPPNNPSQIATSPSLLPTSSSKWPAHILIPQRVASPSASGALPSQPLALGASTEHTFSSNAVTPMGSTKASVQPKTKKKRKSSANYADFLAADIEWYKQKPHTGTADPSSSSMPSDSGPSLKGQKRHLADHNPSIIQELGSESPVLSAAEGRSTILDNQYSLVPSRPNAQPMELDQAHDSDAMAILTAALGIPPLNGSTSDTIIQARHNSDVRMEDSTKGDLECSITKNQPEVGAQNEKPMIVSPETLWESTRSNVAQVKSVPATQGVSESLTVSLHVAQDHKTTDRASSVAAHASSICVTASPDSTSENSTVKRILSGQSHISPANQTTREADDKSRNENKGVLCTYMTSELDTNAPNDGDTNVNDTSDDAHPGITTTLTPVTCSPNKDGAMDVDSAAEDAIAGASLCFPSLSGPDEMIVDAHSREVRDGQSGMGIHSSRCDDKVSPMPFQTASVLEEGEITPTEPHTTIHPPEVVIAATESPNHSAVANLPQESPEELTRDVLNSELKTSFPNILSGPGSLPPSVRDAPTDTVPCFGNSSGNDDSEAVSAVVHLTKAKEPAAISSQAGIDHDGNAARIAAIDQLLPRGNLFSDRVNDAMFGGHPVDTPKENSNSGETEIARSAIKNGNRLRIDGSVIETPNRSTSAGRKSDTDTEDVKNRKRTRSPLGCEGEERIVRRRINGSPHPNSLDQPKLDPPHSSYDVPIDKNEATSSDHPGRDRLSTALDLVGASAVTIDTTRHMDSEGSLDYDAESFRAPSSAGISLRVNPPSEVPGNKLKIAGTLGATSSISSQGSIRNGVRTSLRTAVFGPEMTVIAFQRGSKSRTVATIEFNIDEVQHALLSKWNNRNKPTGDATECLCVSLACYPRTNIQIILKNTSKHPSLEELTLDDHCSWPQTGGLSVEVKYKEDRQNFPLSPPFVVTPDNLVDLSPFLEPGRNTFRLDQQFNMSDYIFVFHAHFPTTSQLQEVSDRRKRDQDWKEWLLKMSQPFKVHLPWGVSESTRSL